MSLAKLTSISTKTLSLLLERQRLQTLPNFATPTSPLHDADSNGQPMSTHLVQIKKNLEQLRLGILTMQEKEGEGSEAVSLLKNQYERMRGMLGSDAAQVLSIAQQPSGGLQPSVASTSSISLPSSSSSPQDSPITREPLPSIGLSRGGSSASKQAALFLSSSSSNSSHTRNDSHNAVFAPYKDDPSSQPTSSQSRALSNSNSNLNNLNPSPKGYTPGDEEAGGDDDTHALLQSQRFLMSEQDQRLDELSHSINRQHHLSIQINDEMDVQHGLLEDLDGGIDSTSGRLGSARRRLDRVAKGIKENSSVFMIGVLIFVLLVLIIVLKT